jgi:hypothetical protein
MKGKAGLLIFIVYAFFLHGRGQAAQFQGNAFIMNAQGGIQLAPPSTAASANAPGFVPPTGNVLEFMDGSLMHGELKSVDVASGLSWDNPFAQAPIDLKPGHIDLIRFAHAQAVEVNPTSRLHFANGDDLYGTVSSLDADHVVFSTWFGGSRTIPRSALQSVSMLSSNYSIVYEGPDDAEGWIIGNHNPESWTLVDGAFVSSSPGTLGRDFKLTGSCTISFDLAWTEPFEIVMNLFSDAVDHLEMNDSYVLALTPETIDFRRIDAGHQFPVHDLGSAPVPRAPGKTKVRITIQANKSKGTVAVYVDNVLAKRWKDDGNLSAAGGGILFQQTGVNGSTVRLSNFEISQWEGRHEPETSFASTNVDVIRLVNYDEAGGKITGISDGKVTIRTTDTVLQVPLARVTQINFAASAVAAATADPWEVRAHFPHGGSVSFQLEKWSGKEVSGQSAIFGTLAFQPGHIRQLEFNIDKARVSRPARGEKEFEGLDE